VRAMPSRQSGGRRSAQNKTAVHSSCVQVHVHDICRSSVSLLSNKKANGEIPLVLIPTARSPFSLLMQVPTGVYCLAQKFGQDMGEIGPGLHVLPAYWRIAYIVSKQANTYDAPVLSCPTVDDVRVNINVVVVFSINEPSNFVYRLGARNFDDFLSATVDEAIRVMVRKEDHKTVYNLRSEKADTMLKLLNDKFNECGVTFTDVKITAVWLPDSLAECLENTTKMDKAMDKIKRQNEFEIMQIKQESEMTIEEIKRKSEQVLVSESGRKRRAELEFEQRSVKAEEDGRVALIDAQAQAEAQILQVTTQLNRTKTELETWRVKAVSEAEANASALKVKADLDEEAAIIQGSWQEEQMICDAEATKHEASAEKVASRCLVARRQHEMDLREKSILEKLAVSGNFNLTGVPGDRIVSAMLTGSLAGGKQS